jgi:hypothetical protein
MGLIADLAERLEILIYIGLAAGAVLYLRALLRAHRQLRGTVFGLERESLYARRSRAFSMLFTCLFLATALYVSIHLIAPALELTRPGSPGRATPSVLMTPLEPTGPVLAPLLPTLSPEQLTSIALGTPLPTATATEATIPAGVGCENPLATLTFPAFGETVAGPVEVTGTANIADFAFYKMEINGPATGGNWQTLSAGSTPVKDGVLGTWDASIYTAGSYNFRLVVYDAAGNWPPPCVVPITIVAIPESR